jgi:hypothetical protein
MNKIQELTKVSRTVREELGLTKEEIFWMQIDMGSEFLKIYYPEESLRVATQTNFWDIYVFEWVKDDAEILEGKFCDLSEICLCTYAQLKRGMPDGIILKQLKTLLRWKST